VAEILISDEVRAALGTEGAQRAAALYHAGGRCTVCDRELPPPGPVTVVLATGGGQYHVSYAHPDCSRSILIELPAAVMNAAMPDVLDMVITALVVDEDERVLPALVAETPTGVPMLADARGDQPGELASVMTTTLLRQGFSLVWDFEELPARAGGWRIAVRPDRPGVLHLEITGRQGLLFYTGTALPPGDWLSVAERARWCVLYASAEPVPWPDVVDSAGTLAALQTAAATGGLVGAQVPIVWEP
jgi:hypothetical protein